MKLDEFILGIRVYAIQGGNKIYGVAGNSVDCRTGKMNVVVKFDSGGIGIITDRIAHHFHSVEADPALN